MEYTFYRITHPEYPGLNYIGSTKEYPKRKCKHKYACYNEKSNNYNKPFYRFIRDNDIIWDELQWTILNKLTYETKESVYKWERFLIESFETIKNGLNETYHT